MLKYPPRVQWYRRANTRSYEALKRGLYCVLRILIALLVGSTGMRYQDHRFRELSVRSTGMQYQDLQGFCGSNDGFHAGFR